MKIVLIDGSQFYRQLVIDFMGKKLPDIDAKKDFLQLDSYESGKNLLNKFKLPFNEWTFIITGSSLSDDQWMGLGFELVQEWVEAIKEQCDQEWMNEGKEDKWLSVNRRLGIIANTVDDQRLTDKYGPYYELKATCLGAVALFAGINKKARPENLTNIIINRENKGKKVEGVNYLWRK